MNNTELMQLWEDLSPSYKKVFNNSFDKFKRVMKSEE